MNSNSSNFADSAVKDREVLRESNRFRRSRKDYDELKNNLKTQVSQQY
jgi:hypothetical protein